MKTTKSYDTIKEIIANEMELTAKFQEKIKSIVMQGRAVTEREPANEFEDFVTKWHYIFPDVIVPTRKGDFWITKAKTNENCQCGALLFGHYLNHDMTPAELSINDHITAFAVWNTLCERYDSR